MNNKEEIILGIDPGTAVTGYGVIRTDGRVCLPIDFGAIRPAKGMSLEKRYLAIFNGVEQLIAKYKPDAVSVETQFVKDNIASAMKLGMARGAVMIAAARQDIPIFCYEPRKVKKAVVGTGSASKHQMQQMTQQILGLSVCPTPEDAADALGLAICHAFNKGRVDLLMRSL